MPYVRVERVECGILIITNGESLAGSTPGLLTKKSMPYIIRQLMISKVKSNWLSVHDANIIGIGLQPLEFVGASTNHIQNFGQL
jgi:hypothetical protein